MASRPNTNKIFPKATIALRNLVVSLSIFIEPERILIFVSSWFNPPLSIYPDRRPPDRGSTSHQEACSSSSERSHNAARALHSKGSSVLLFWHSRDGQRQ